MDVFSLSAVVEPFSLGGTCVTNDFKPEAPTLAKN
jgi:hypothetical protein